jgi:Host cell surface-exposed lipoprotein
MKLILSIAAGIILAIVLLTAGCAALVGSAANEASKSTANEAVADTTPDAPDAPEGTSETASQDNARRSAESYLEMSAFSRKGLIQQLSSSAGEGFSRADAIYAVNHIDVDWNEQAAKSAKGYLDMSTFSRQGLIEQLSSDAGEGFTYAQAVYGVNQTGL